MKLSDKYTLGIAHFARVAEMLRNKAPISLRGRILESYKDLWDVFAEMDIRQISGTLQKSGYGPGFMRYSLDLKNGDFAYVGYDCSGCGKLMLGVPKMSVARVESTEYLECFCFNCDTHLDTQKFEIVEP